MVIKHANDPVPKVRDRNPRLHVETEALITKAMEKEPKERFQDAGALAKAAARVLKAIR
jgi:hypothetical protein